MIENELILSQKLDYIHNNPVEAGIVENAEDYLYNITRDYGTRKGLIDVEFLSFVGVFTDKNKCL